MKSKNLSLYLFEYNFIIFKIILFRILEAQRKLEKLNSNLEDKLLKIVIEFKIL